MVVCRWRTAAQGTWRGQRDLEGHAAHGVESPSRLQLERQAAHQQAGAGDQDERPGEFADDERPANSQVESPAPRTASAAAQDFHERAAAIDEHRNHTDEDRGERDHAERGERGASIEVSSAARGRRVEPKARRSFRPAIPAATPATAAGGDQQRDLCQHFACKAACRTSECRADRQIPAAPVKLREHELSRVHARDHEDEQHSSEQAGQHRLHVADHLLSKLERAAVPGGNS